MSFIRNMGKEEGETARHHCDNLSFILMLVCFVFAFVCSACICYTIISSLVERKKKLKAIPVGLFHCHITINIYSATIVQ